MLRWIIIVFSLISVFKSELANKIVDQCPNLRADLKSIRKRRHLTFPDGSAATITISLAKAFHTHAPSGWMMTSDLDVIYPLPEANFTNRHFRKKLHHRQKKDVWERLKEALYLSNMNGHECVLRSICEAKVHLAPKGRSLVHDILRAIFTVPLDESDFAEEVKGTYREILDPNFCDRTHECPFSLLHFLLQFNKEK